MAKKKHQTKKHSFKHAAPTAPAASAVSGHKAAAPTRASAAPATSSTVRDFSYVGRDLKQLLVFATGLIVLELALWLAVDYTPLGNVLYNLIKL